MAGQADKKQAKKAESSIQYYLFAIIGVNLLYLIFRVFLAWDSMGKWNLCGMLLFSGVSYFTFGAIKSSLEVGATFEMYLDLFLVNLATQALVTFSDYGWLLYLSAGSGLRRLEDHEAGHGLRLHTHRCGNGRERS
ncbi:unnamed protein product [Effrenium voratum]|nr:unnamed protein product [Effrenium voratum]